MEGDGGSRGNSEGVASGVANDANLVARVLRDIDARGTSQRYLLLDDLLCAAWPSERGQRQ